jgi:hypothetical protein
MHERVEIVQLGILHLFQKRKLSSLRQRGILSPSEETRGFGKVGLLILRFLILYMALH